MPAGLRGGGSRRRGAPDDLSPGVVGDRGAGGGIDALVDTVVGSALRALLEGSGYRTDPIDSHPTGIADDPLGGAGLLLLAPRLDEGARQAFVGAIGKSIPLQARTPVIALSTSLEKARSTG